MNWRRPANVLRLVDDYLAMPQVAGMTVVDCNPEAALQTR